MPKSFSQTILLPLLLATTVYFVAGRLGMLLAIPPGYSTALFPAAGIAFGLVLSFGERMLPAIFAGQVLFHLSLSFGQSTGLSIDSVSLALILAGIAVFQAAAAQRLILHALKERLVLDSNRDIFYFFLCTVVVSLISSAMGVTALRLMGRLSSAEADSSWLVWWVGDVLGVITTTPLVLVLFARPAALWRSRRFNVLVPLSLCLLVVLVAFLFIRERETQKQQLEFRLEAQRMSQNIQNRLNSNADVMDNIERLFSSSRHVEREEFATFVQHALRGNPAIGLLTWVPLVRHAQKSEFERSVASEGYPTFRMTEKDDNERYRPVRDRDEYFPMRYLQPYNSPPDLAGFDLGSVTRHRNAIEDARDTNQITATDPMLDERGQKVVMLYVPVYLRGHAISTPTERREAFDGVAAGMFRVADMIQETLSPQEKNDMLIKFYDLSYPVSNGVFIDTIGASDPAFQFQSTIHFGGKQYAFLVQASPLYWKTHISWVTWSAMVGGLLFTGLFGAYLLMTSAHTYNVETLVKQRTAELHESEERLSSILDHAAEGILTCNTAGLIQSANPSAEALFHFPPGSLKGRQLFSLFPEECAQKTLHQHIDAITSMENTSTMPKANRVEIRARQRSGDDIPLELAMTRVSLGTQTLLVIILHDLSEIKRADKLKSEFVSAVSHELRTPLTSIRGALGLLKGVVAPNIPEQAQKLLDMANDNAVRLTSLINDILDFEKLEYGGMQFHPEDHVLQHLVNQSIEANQGYAENFHVNLELAKQQIPDLWVHVDAQRFVQVLSNLLSNAIKFSGKKAQVDVRLSVRGDWIKVEVQDYGIGISDDFKSSIFQKFTQAEANSARKYAGTGLGLSLSKTMIEKMGGKIGFKSEEGHGSLFYLLLPLIPPPDQRNPKI
ncbi:CHASE domain-containing protein [Undibacterium crateris]|uniref:CHASE domain-containing protein n=1 Tax=Undibacterium crateris TaxID=2528175 RepID=UPI00138A0244|nr:CHASE domain-containing protein [Undibacterium crateris]NDI87285.1 PAS domain S-box protein [Undibacterium crateris]